MLGTLIGAVAVTALVVVPAGALEVGSGGGTALSAGAAHVTEGTLTTSGTAGTAGTASTAGRQPPPVPTKGAYLGAWVDPEAIGETNSNTVEGELSELSDFQADIGRPLAIVHAYQQWSTPLSNQTLEALASTGAIPMIDWACGDTDEHIIEGDDDTMLTTYALQLKQYGGPLFMRWYWEPNFPKSANYKDCIDPNGAIGYAEAWQHIWRIFNAVGDTNVAWVWNPASSGTLTGLQAYYPGNQYVNWIGIDGYDRTGHETFTDIFKNLYDELSLKDKPMLIGETGAPATASGTDSAQATYLGTIASEVPSQFPDIKAIMYFDAERTGGGQGVQQFTLTPAGTDAFASLGENPYFAVMPAS